jgi:hypothetical protein
MLRYDTQDMARKQNVEGKMPVDKMPRYSPNPSPLSSNSFTSLSFPKWLYLIITLENFSTR